MRFLAELNNGLNEKHPARPFRLSGDASIGFVSLTDPTYGIPYSKRPLKGQP
jgi:hypothetical protein